MIIKRGFVIEDIPIEQKKTINTENLNGGELQTFDFNNIEDLQPKLNIVQS